MKYKKSFSVLLAIIISSAVIRVVAMADIPLQKIILKSTVYIKNEFGNVGSGFLISKKMGENRSAVFLITNKHVLRKDGDGDYSRYIDVRFYKKDPKDNESAIQWSRIPILGRKDKFSEIVFMHPEEQIDIVGISINDLVNRFSSIIDFINFRDDNILTREIAQKEAIDAGEDLLVLGYTAGIFSKNNYLPLVKSCLLSSSSSEDLAITLGDKIIKGKIYLVDGSLFGGNSGGPVIIKSRWKITREKDGIHQNVNLGEGLPLYILGVQSQSIQLNEKIYTRIFGQEETPLITSRKNVDKRVEKDDRGEYIPVDKDIMLNIVFSAEYINDIFDMFMKKVATL